MSIAFGVTAAGNQDIDARLSRRAKGAKDKPWGLVGDGIANDTVAMDTLLATAGDIEFPAGTYLVDYFRVRSNSRIKGRQGAVIKCRSTCTTFASATDADDWSVAGLTFDCDNKANVGFAPLRCERWEWSGEIKNIAPPEGDTIGAIGFNLGAGCLDWTVEDFYFHDIVGAADGIGGNSTGPSRGLGSFVSDDTHAKRGRIRKGRIENITPREDGDGLTLQGGTSLAHIDIEDVRFDHCAKRAIKIVTPGVTARRCRIFNPYAGAAPGTDDMYAGISVYASDVSVEDNDFYGGSFAAMVEIGTPDASLARIKCRGNRGRNGDSDAGAANALIMVIGDVDASQIEGNVMEKSARYGIWVRGNYTNGSISRNNMRACTLQGIVLTGDGAGGVPKHVQLRDNHTDGDSYGVNIDQGEDITVAGTRGATTQSLVLVGASATNVVQYDNVGTGLLAASPARAGVNNRGGTVVISDTATFADIAFPVAEPDGGYRLYSQAYGVTGTPAVNSFICYATDRLATGFRLRLGAAPGAGNSVAVNWDILR